MSYIWFSIGRFSLIFSMASIELNESVYITHLMSSLSFMSFIAILLLSSQLCEWRLLLAVPLFWLCLPIQQHILFSFLFSLIYPCRLPCYYRIFNCIVRSATFFLSHSWCVFHIHSRIICYLLTTGVVVSGSSLLSPSVLPYIFVPVFSCTLL